MPTHPATIVGAAICFASAATFTGLLFARGGWKRSTQLGVLIALARGEHGARSRSLAILAFAGVVLGILVMFAGVAANDVARERRCQARCVELQHARGVIGPSVEMNMTRRNTPAFLACSCSGGAGPSVELHADGL